MTDNNVELGNSGEFSARHIGPAEKEQKQMLDAIGVASLDVLINKTIF